MFSWLQNFPVAMDYVCSNETHMLSTKYVLIKVVGSEGVLAGVKQECFSEDAQHIKWFIYTARIQLSVHKWKTKKYAVEMFNDLFF